MGRTKRHGAPGGGRRVVTRSIYFGDEHEAFRDEVRRFLVHEVAPHAERWERDGRIPREIFGRMGRLGYLGITVPERYGGSGADLLYAAVFLEELPRSMMGGFNAAVSVQQFMATPHILRAGSDALIRRFVVPSVEGRAVGALAITEPDAGSDVAAIRTTARRDGDAFVVNGAKTFITNGADGDFLTLAVRTGDAGAGGISLLAVERDTPGVRVANRLAKLGWHASDTAELVFEDARVPADRLIGRENGGFAQLMESFALERLCSALIAVGGAHVTLELTLEHIARRRAFGSRIDRFQAIRHRVADMVAEIEAARQLSYHVAWLLDRGETATREAAMAKLVATELAKRVADECLQFFGGYGFMEEYPIARLWRDARGGTITAGTSEIMREIVARETIDRSDED
ncbi:MAG TPA: acyl-CoA dehydrogenase family protein [Candidatus Polarisedimenticolaceae bacterium]|nr:acyl-CoA dehydrogenase family protein [Candidatus Polarisedimenticolaceae bacterium]